MKVYVKENSYLAKLAARRLKTTQVAIVFGNVIYLWNVSKNDFIQNTSWLRHEVAHVHQYKQYGFTRFILLYLLEASRNGYKNNRFEIEAREREKDLGVLENVDLF